SNRGGESHLYAEESRRRHSNNCEGMAANSDRLADNGRIRCKSLTPVVVAQYFDRVPRRTRIFQRKGTADVRVHAEHGEVVPGNELCRRPFNAAAVDAYIQIELIVPV